MKFSNKFILILCWIFLANYYHILSQTPSVSVNYLPKKQWKLSKHDLSDIKLDIEREMRSKILQLQMDWENKQRMEDTMAYNQFAPVIPPSFFQQTQYSPSTSTNVYNAPRFFQRERDDNNLEKFQSDDDRNLKEEMEETLKRLKKLRNELYILKSQEKNIKNEKIIHDGTFKNDTITNDFLKVEQINKINPLKHKAYPITNLNEIINKYSSHKVGNEFSVFTNIFKNYNMTNSNHVNVKEVTKKIGNMIDRNYLKNIIPKIPEIMPKNKNNN